MHLLSLYDMIPRISDIIRGTAPQYPILDLIESEHGYSVDRAAVERITSQQDYRGAYEMLITISSNNI